MHRLTARASQDVRMDEPLADACFEDRSRLCDGVQPVRPGAPALRSAPRSRPRVCSHRWSPGGERVAGDLVLPSEAQLQV